MAKYRKAKIWTDVMILDDWTKAVKKGLGRKKLDPAIALKVSPPLLLKIQARLAAGGDYNKEGANTRIVAKTLGQICKLVADGNTVSLPVFEAAFDLCQLHPACPGGSGGGQWCNI
jgi:hypothetical protein